MQFTDGNWGLGKATGKAGGVLKRAVIFAVALSFAAMLCGMSASAASAGELKGKWREKTEYPVKFLDEDLHDDGFGHMVPKASDEWSEELGRLGATGVTYALNPPEDVLSGLSSVELAELFLKWPWLHLVNAYDTEYDTFFQYAELNSDVFYELLSREDGYACILEAYRNNPFDVDENNANPYFNLSLDLTEKAEIFGCKFIQYYHQNFTQKEYELACEIMKEKAALYEKLNDEADVKRELKLDPIEPPEGDAKELPRANYLTPEQREELWSKMLESGQIEKEQPPVKDADSQDATKEETQGNKEQGADEVQIVEEKAIQPNGLWLIIPCVLLCGGLAYVWFRKKS